MITVRPSRERGHTELDWLDSYHTFSFDRYDDPRHMGFRHLRVINEDRVQPGAGFGMHGHRDMEILTWVLEGALEHRDSAGHQGLLRPGEIQHMSAGTGIRHSEYNASAAEPVHLLQIWILPERQGLPPSYEQRAFAFDSQGARWHLLASGDGRDGAARIRQDAELYVARLVPGKALEHRLKPGRHAWIQVARGKVTLNATPLEAGDGAAASEEETLRVRAEEPSEVLLFDLV